MSANPNTAEPGKPQRRRFQFSLRTLLIVVVVAALICALGKRCAEYLKHPMPRPDGDAGEFGP